MNTKIKQDTAALMAMASKLDTRTNLFLQSVGLIQEHQMLCRRLVQQMLALQAEVEDYATRSNTKPDGPRIQEASREAPGQGHGNANSPGIAGNSA